MNLSAPESPEIDQLASLAISETPATSEPSTVAIGESSSESDTTKTADAQLLAPTAAPSSAVFSIPSLDTPLARFLSAVLSLSREWFSEGSIGAVMYRQIAEDVQECDQALTRGQEVPTGTMRILRTHFPELYAKTLGDDFMASAAPTSALKPRPASETISHGSLSPRLKRRMDSKRRVSFNTADYTIVPAPPVPSTSSSPSPTPAAPLNGHRAPPPLPPDAPLSSRRRTTSAPPIHSQQQQSVRVPHDSATAHTASPTLLAGQPPPSRREWVPDRAVTRCMVCKQGRFGTFNRRHHCRQCGKVVCALCSSTRLLLPSVRIDSPVRVCAECVCNAAVSTAMSRASSHTPSRPLSTKR